MKKHLLPLLFLLASGACNAQQVINFELIYDYIMAKGDVNGQQGRFFLDTGTPMSFLINSNNVSLQQNEHKGIGTLSSGEQFELYRSFAANTVTVGDVQQSGIQVNDGNLNFMDKVCKDCIGLVGFGFFHDYRFAIDLKKKTWTLYPLSSRNEIDMTKHPSVLTVRFTTNPRYPQTPLCQSQLGSQTFETSFDTGGTFGWLNVTPQMKAQLVAEKAIALRREGFVIVKNLNIGGVQIPAIKNMRIKESNTNSIILGCEFLKNYISVWDYNQSEIEFFKN